MTELPPAVEQLLLDVVADGFTVYCCGPFAPEFVVWAYEGPAECAVRALLHLVHPEHRDATVWLLASN